MTRTAPLDTTPPGGAVLSVVEADEATESGIGLDHALLSAGDETVLAMRIEAGLWARHLLTTNTFDQKTSTGPTVEELEWLAMDGENARREFIEQNLRLAVSTARKFRGRGFSDEDVKQDAYQGLVKAVDRFDYRRGFKFSTYAVWWIRESILSGIRDSGFVKHPEALWNQIVKVRAAKMSVLDHTGDTATIEEIATKAEVSVREVNRCLRSDVPVSSLQLPIGEDLALGDVLRDDDAVHALVDVEYRHDHDRLATIMQTLLSGLDEPEQHVLVARYGLDGSGHRSLTAVAAELGLNRQTVRVREQRALSTLAQASADLEPYRLLFG